MSRTKPDAAEEEDILSAIKDQYDKFVKDTFDQAFREGFERAQKEVREQRAALLRRELARTYSMRFGACPPSIVESLRIAELETLVHSVSLIATGSEAEIARALGAASS